MTISKVQIYNIALNILGVSSPLENVNSTDNKAILLNNYYDLARDFVLKDFDWNFANSYRSLSLAYKQDCNYNYQYVYDYPNDCICARDVFESDSRKYEKFHVCLNSDNEKVILTNAKEPVLRYTRKIDKEILFSSEFSMALAFYLASLASNVICGSVQKGEIAYEKYQKILRHAKMLNAQEGADFLVDDDTYIEARG